MQIRNIRKGDVIQTKADGEWSEFKDDKWRVLKAYPHMVLTQSIRVPQIRRCFCYGDLIVMNLEWQGFDHIAASQEIHQFNLIKSRAKNKKIKYR